MTKKLLTIPEFGAAYGPKLTKTYAMLKNGELKAVKNGKRTYISLEEAERWANSLQPYKPEHAGA